MAYGIGEFTKSSYDLGEEIVFGYTIVLAERDRETGEFFRIRLYMPGHIIRTQYIGETEHSKVGTLRAPADDAGEWHGSVSYFDGSRWTDLVYTTTVGELPPPSPPPPGPPTGVYTLTVLTNPAVMRFDLLDATDHPLQTFYTGSTGRTDIPNLAPAMYKLRGSKTGYYTKTIEVQVLGHTTTRLELNPIPPEPEPPEPEPEPEPEPPGPDPGVFDWLVELILLSVEYFIGFTFGVVNDTIKWIQDFKTAFTADLAKFFEDPIKYIQDAVDSLIPALSDWWNGILSGINTWYDENIAPIFDSINTTLTGIGSWIDSGFSNIGSWWESVRHTVSSWFDNVWKDLNTFWTDITSHIGTWWDDTKKTIWDGLQSSVAGLQSWLDNVGTWIGDWWKGVSDGIGEWWSSTVADLGKSWDDFANGIGSVWDGITKQIGDAIDTAVKNIEKWVNETIPGIVEGMFEWAKPVIQPIMDAVGFLGTIVDTLTGTAPAEPEIEEAKDRQKEIYEKLEETIRRARGF